MHVFSPYVGDEESAAVANVLASQWLGTGTQCVALEQQLASLWKVSVEQLSLTNSCTSAIYVGLRALGVGDGDAVLTPTIQYHAVANAAMMLRARVVLCDVNPRTLMPEPEHIDRTITSDTRVVALLHYGGHVCHTEELRPVIGPRAVILEDAACAPMSLNKGRAVGTLEDCGVWSFDAVKMLTMGSGGALYLKDPEKARRARTLINHGMSVKSGYENRKSDRWWEFSIESPSGAFASNDISATIGLQQLKKASLLSQKRAALYAAYDAYFGDASLPIYTPPTPEPVDTISHYTYWIQTSRRDELARYLLDKGIYTTFRYYPLHRVYGIGGHFPNADRAADMTLNLPLHPFLSVDDVGRVVKEIAAFFNSGRRN